MVCDSRPLRMNGLKNPDANIATYQRGRSAHETHGVWLLVRCFFPVESILKRIVYVTNTPPYHVVGIASLKTTASTSSRTGAGALNTLASAVFPVKSVSLSNVATSDSDYELSANSLSDAQQEQLLKQLGSNVEELRNSIDSEVQFSLKGSVRLSPCNQTACTAIATISNSLTSGDPRVQASTTIRVDVVITMTLDGQFLDECDGTINMIFL